jgi:thiol-disulfide isomerase/thioredoxin
MSIMHLESKHFYLDDSAKGGKVLCCTNKGILFVMFHLNASACPNCKTVAPEFDALSKSFNSSLVQFASVNLSTFPDIAKKSGSTISPITYVPYFIIYVNGRPFLRWDGDKTARAMHTFLNDVLNKIPPNIKQELAQYAKTSGNGSAFNTAAEEKPVFPGGGVPYNVVCDKASGVCYLNFEEFKRGVKP